MRRFVVVALTERLAGWLAGCLAVKLELASRCKSKLPKASLMSRERSG